MERSKLSISPMMRDPLHRMLRDFAPCSEKTEQSCLYRLDYQTANGWVRVKQYTNGTLYVEATDSTAYSKVMTAIEALTGQSTSLAISNGSSRKPVKAAASTNIGLTVPYIGTDESGKGDYFGPLVIAGVYSTPETAETMRSIGVRDSKELNDAQIIKVAADLRALIGENASVIIEIGPAKYNDLYERFKQSGKNLNHLLAWGHAKALETLLEKHPDCQHAIADQFGSEHYIKSQLQTRGKGITLHQTPRAEANLGVAAASILARARFVQKLQALGQPYNLSLPPGASNHVVETAKVLYSRHGMEALRSVAKLHFKSTERVIGI